MKIEEIFEEFGRSVKQEKLQDIVFTPVLEQKIRDKIAKRSNRHYRYLSGAAASAALLAISLYLFPSMTTREPAVEILEPESTQQTNQRMHTMEQEALDRLKLAIPALQQFRVEQKDSYQSYSHIFLRKAEREYAGFGMNQKTGELGYFFLNPADEPPNREPEKSVAKEKAAFFLRAVLPDKTEHYQIGKISPALKVIDSETSQSVVVGTDVSFLPVAGAAFPLENAITIRVDAGGRVVSYSHVDQFDGTLLEKLFRHIPEMSEYALESKNPVEGGYSIILRKDDREYVQVGVQTAKDGDVTLGSLQWKRETPAAKHVPSPASVTEKATAFLQDFLVDEMENYRMDVTSVPGDPYNPGNHTSLSFQRIVKGIPVQQDTLTMIADASGEIIDYTRMVMNLPEIEQFPDPNLAVAREAAERELADNMKLRYRMNQGPRLEYTPAMAGTWDIDARTGKMRYLSSAEITTYDQNPQAAIKLNPPSKQVSVKTKEEAMALLKKEFGVDLTGMVFREGEDRSRNVNMYDWESSNHQPGKNVDIHADKTTGQIKRISTYRVDKTIKVSREDAQQEAIRFLEKYIDPEVKEVVIGEIVDAGDGNGYTTSGDWEFRFGRSHSGIPLSDPALRQYIVTVDPSTGKANGYVSMQYGNSRAVHVTATSKFPDKRTIVSKETAAKEYLKYFTLELAYKLERQEGKQEYSPVLVYVPVRGKQYAYKGVYIDAVTGKAVIGK